MPFPNRFKSSVVCVSFGPVCACCDVPIGGTGVDGRDAFSVLLASYVQPGLGSNVTVLVQQNAWIVPGQYVFIQGGGIYQVISKTSDGNTVVQNVGSPLNAIAGAGISAGQISPAGAPGPAGTVAANFTDPIASMQSATPVLIRSIALTDNAVTRLVVVTLTRDTTTHIYCKKSSIEWKRVNGGGAIELGGANGEDGPIVKDEIGVTGASQSVNVGDSTKIDLKYGGTAAVKTAGTMITYVEIDLLPAAT